MSLSDEQQIQALIGRVEDLENRLKLPSTNALIDGSSGTWKSVPTVSSDKISVPTISGGYNDVRDWMNNTQSSGKISGGAFTDNTDGTAKIGSGAGLIRTSNTELGEVKFFSWEEHAVVTLTDNATNYIIVTYSKAPVVSATTTKSDGNNRNVVLLGKIYRSGTDLHLVAAGMIITEATKRVLAYLTQVHGEVIRASGYAVAESGERYLTTTAGVLYAGLTQLTTTGIDTTGADTFETYYYDGDLGTPAWVKGSASQIDNANYNAVATGLAALTSNRYGVHWVYGDADGHVMVVYGQGDYTLANAEAATPPSSLPNQIADFSFIAAKIIVQEGEANLYAVLSAYETLFTLSGAADHGELGGLDTGADHSYIDQDVTSGSSPTFDGTNFTGIPDGAMDTDYVEVGGDTMTGDLTFDGNYHPVLSPGSDTDARIFQVAVTGTPYMLWVESQDRFYFSKGIHLNGESVMITNVVTDETAKYARLVGKPYDNSDGDFIFFMGYADATNNYARIGGGTSAYKACTKIVFYTAPDTLTDKGTERAMIDEGGGLKLRELAAAGADTAAFGQIWVKAATPNELWFTNDAGTDTQLRGNKLCSRYGPSSNVNIGTSWTTVQCNTADREDTDYYTYSSGEITLLKAGDYKISYHVVGYDGTVPDNLRWMIWARLQQKLAAGSFAVVEGTYTGSYNTLVGATNFLSITCAPVVYTAAVNDVIKLEADGSQGGVHVSSGRSRIFIEYLG